MRGNESILKRLQLNLGLTSNKNFLIPKPNFVFKNNNSGASLWNSVPLWIKNSSTFESFIKKMLFSGPLGFTCWISFAPVFGFMYG